MIKIDLEKLTNEEHKLYIMAKKQFENGQTYQLYGHKLRESLKEDYALFCIKRFQYYSKHPYGSIYRKNYDDMIDKYDRENINNKQRIK